MSYPGRISSRLLDGEANGTRRVPATYFWRLTCTNRLILKTEAELEAR